MPVIFLLTFPFTHVIVFFGAGLGDGVGETVRLGVAVGVGVRKARNLSVENLNI